MKKGYEMIAAFPPSELIAPLEAPSRVPVLLREKKKTTFQAQIGSSSGTEVLEQRPR